MADAVFLLVRLISGETAAGIEQLAIQPLLPFDGSGVEPAGLELARQLARLLRERTRGARIAARLQALQLLGERALPARELAQPLHHGITTGRHHREQPLRIAVHALLLLRHARELFERLLETRSRLRAGDLLRRAHQRVGGGVERVQGLFGERRGRRRVGIALLQLLARLTHLVLRVAQGSLELR